MTQLFAKLKPEIRAIIVNVQTVPQKRNELLSLITCLENNFYKTQVNSSRGNRNDPKKNRHGDNNRGKNDRYTSRNGGIFDTILKLFVKTRKRTKFNAKGKTKPGYS